MITKSHGDSDRRSGRLVAWLFRGVITLNFLRLGLSFWPWFEGTAGSVGECDRLFGDLRWGGFRIDFLWLTASTLVIFVAIFPFCSLSKLDRRARLDAFLCGAWTVGYVVYLGRALATGLLDFG